MGRIVPIPWKQFERFLIRAGCKYIRQESSHRIYWKNDLKRPIILPTYKKIPVFIIKNNLRLLGMSNEEYLNLLKKS